MSFPLEFLPGLFFPGPLEVVLEFISEFLLGYLQDFFIKFLLEVLRGFLLESLAKQLQAFLVLVFCQSFLTVSLLIFERHLQDLFWRFSLKNIPN